MEEESSSNTPPETNNPLHNFLPTENPNSPFYLHYSDNASSVIVSPPLTGPNYLSWSRSFSLSISIKNKLGFLDGTITKPELTDPLYLPWLRCNNIILSWLLNSISKEIASNVLYISSTKAVWDKLKLGTIVQGTQTVNEYFTQLNAVWKELNIYRPVPCCSCEVQQFDNVFKFLMGLNDSYESIREQVILMSPVPSIDKAFSLILQEERQRQARIVAIPPTESSALAVFNNQSKKKERPELTCGHCGKTGHSRDKCYRLIGFPPNFKFTKQKPGHFNNQNFSATHSANQVISQGQEKEVMEAPNLTLSQSQIQQLIALVNNQTP
ncbi:hypothetical protein I3760_05G116900 [Carya illinoinensis]|nr:hypothetical protein I3760_05G116900 [Carya illinoinensis]